MLTLRLQDRYFCIPDSVFPWCPNDILLFQWCLLANTSNFEEPRKMTCKKSHGFWWRPDAFSIKKLGFFLVSPEVAQCDGDLVAPSDRLRSAEHTRGGSASELWGNIPGLVNLQKAIEHGHLDPFSSLIYLLKMVIFHSKMLPEGNYTVTPIN